MNKTTVPESQAAALMVALAMSLVVNVWLAVKLVDARRDLDTAAKMVHALRVWVDAEPQRLTL